MASLPVYNFADDHGTQGSTDMEQHGLVHPVKFYPSASIAIRKEEYIRGVGARRFAPLPLDSDVSLNKGDLVFKARSENEIRDILGLDESDNVNSLWEPERSYFSVFNGLRKPETMEQARITYSFMGIAIAGEPAMGHETELMGTVVREGIVNFKNETTAPFLPGQEVTWMIEDSTYCSKAALDRSYMWPVSKKKHVESKLVRGMFVPIHTRQISDIIVEEVLRYAYKTAVPDARAAVASSLGKTPVDPGKTESKASTSSVSDDLKTKIGVFTDTLRNSAALLASDSFKVDLSSAIARDIPTLKADEVTTVMKQLKSVQGLGHHLAKILHVHSQNVVGKVVRYTNPNTYGQILLTPR
jgi:hypothetical protein